MSNVIKPKTYSDTFLYNKANLEYEKSVSVYYESR